MNINLIIFISWIVALGICVHLGDKKGHIALGWVVGLLLGWIDVTLVPSS